MALSIIVHHYLGQILNEKKKSRLRKVQLYQRFLNFDTRFCLASTSKSLVNTREANRSSLVDFGFSPNYAFIETCGVVIPIQKFINPRCDFSHNLCNSVKRCSELTYFFLFLLCTRIMYYFGQKCVCQRTKCINCH